MRLTVLGLLLAASLFAEPTQSDRYRYAPLVAAAKLWNLVRYLDPRVTGDSTTWDAALVAAIPKIEAAHSDDDLALALDGMLQTLQDPCTRIAFGLPGPGISVQSLESGTMVIRTGNGDLSGSYGAGLMLQMGIPQTSSIVWDLRSARMPYALVSRIDLSRLPINGLGYAVRRHSGYPPPDGSGLRYYSSSLDIVQPHTPAPEENAATRRQVYLIDKNSAVPVRAIIDQINGRTAILSEDPPEDLQAGFTELVPVLGKVIAEVRVAELYYPDGTTGFAPTRVVLNRGQEAIKAAADALQSVGWGMPGARPRFDLRGSSFRDMPYAENPYPSREMRILAAFRIWGILHYFDPRVSLLGDKWDDVLVELLPKFTGARNAREYHLAIAEMAARSGDPTCLTRSKELDAVFGTAEPSFEIRFVEDQPVITHLFKPGPARMGDVILKIEGRPVQDRIAQLSPYLAAPTPLALQNLLARFLLAGPSAGTLKLTVRGKDNAEREIQVPIATPNPKILLAHRSGDAVRLINQKIGYVDLERVVPADLDSLFAKFQNTPAVIFDLRGFPRDVAVAIAARLGDRRQPLAAELQRNLVGLSSGEEPVTTLQTELRIPASTKSRFTGKTVALLDDVSTGIAAESAMCLKAAGDTTLIGSPAFPTFSVFSTHFDVPGGARISFGGENPRWPDGTALPREGVRPDVEVRPTLAGIRAGRDEVLDKALEFLAR